MFAKMLSVEQCQWKSTVDAWRKQGRGLDVNRSIPDYFITGGIWVQKYALLAMDVILIHFPQLFFT